jgi:hypothetical protein
MFCLKIQGDNIDPEYHLVKTVMNLLVSVKDGKIIGQLSSTLVLCI